MELSLVIDVSGSVNATEYNLMMDGYANAFRDASVQTAILGGTNGAIAVNAVFFASNAISTSLDSFTLLNSAMSINAFADVLDMFVRPGSGGTNIGTGINAAVPLFGDETGGTANGFESTRQVIDVSGDGTGGGNTGATAAALSAGVDVINGIAIGGMSIFDYYVANVIGGTGSFAILAENFEDFETGIRTKLRIETGGGSTSIPEPGTLALFGLGLAGLGLARRRRVA